jgi:hypothetical protein
MCTSDKIVNDSINLRTSLSSGMHSAIIQNDDGFGRARSRKKSSLVGIMSDPSKRVGDLVAKVGEPVNAGSLLGGAVREAVMRVPRSEAGIVFDRLCMLMTRFETSLDPSEEPKLLVASGQGEFSVSNVSRLGTLLQFEGKPEDGSRFTIVQHYSQLSVRFLAQKAADPKKPRKIGFHQEDDAQQEETASR